MTKVIIMIPSLIPLLFLISPISSYTMGAPDTACSSMTPGHSLDPQDPSTSPPATLSISKSSVSPGSTLEFSLDATQGASFKGFVVQVRRGEDLSSLVGSFVISGDDASYMTCNQGIHNSITHRKSTDKTKVKALWRAPTDYEGDVVFRYTVLKTYDTYWVNIDMPPIRVKRDIGNQGTTSTSDPPPITTPSNKDPAPKVTPKTEDPVPIFTPRPQDIVTKATPKSEDPVPTPILQDPTTKATPKAEDPTPSPDPVSQSTTTQDPSESSSIAQPASATTTTQPQQEEEESFTPRYISSTTTLRTTTTVTTTPRPPLAVVDGVLTRTDPLDDIYHGCDQADDDGAMKKGCIGMPSFCTQTRTCTVVATWLYDKGYHFQMKGRSSGFLSFGLSRDASMGEDLTTNCIYNQRNGQVDIQTGYNVGKAFNEPILGASNVTGLLRGGEKRYEDGWISCKWTRMDRIKIKNQVWNLDSDKYHILLAAGPMNSGLIGYHQDTKTRAGVAKGLGEVGIVANKSRLLILLHGSFMIAAWVCSASLGMMIARYYKQTWTNSRSCGLDQWFVLHRSLMILTWLLTVAGFVLIFWHKGSWTDIPYWVNPHAVLGCITTGLCFMQPLIALLRCSPNHGKRVWFNWIHWFIGNVAHITGLVAILFAVDLPSAGLPKPETDYVLVGFVIFHVVSHIIMSSVGCVSDSKAGKVAGFPGVAMRPLGGKANPYHAYPDYEELKRDSPGSAGRVFLLILYAIVNVVITATLILIVVFAPFRSWVADWKLGTSYFSSS